MAAPAGLVGFPFVSLLAAWLPSLRPVCSLSALLPLPSLLFVTPAFFSLSDVCAYMGG